MKSSQGSPLMAWSKNVIEERDCPDQIILGPNDPDFCALLALARDLESHFSEHWGTPWCLFGECDSDNEPLRINDNYMNILRKIRAKRAFKQLADKV